MDEAGSNVGIPSGCVGDCIDDRCNVGVIVIEQQIVTRLESLEGCVGSGEFRADRPHAEIDQGRRREGLQREGCGEVQTPLQGGGARDLSIGDLVFFRYAKAGEMNERFNELHLIQEGRPTTTAPTYRGMGWNFG